MWTLTPNACETSGNPPLPRCLTTLVCVKSYARSGEGTALIKCLSFFVLLSCTGCACHVGLSVCLLCLSVCMSLCNTFFRSLISVSVVYKASPTRVTQPHKIRDNSTIMRCAFLITFFLSSFLPCSIIAASSSRSSRSLKEKLCWSNTEKVTQTYVHKQQERFTWRPTLLSISWSILCFGLSLLHAVRCIWWCCHWLYFHSYIILQHHITSHHITSHNTTQFNITHRGQVPPSGSGQGLVPLGLRAGPGNHHWLPRRWASGLVLVPDPGVNKRLTRNITDFFYLLLVSLMLCNWHACYIRFEELPGTPYGQKGRL